MGDNVDVLSQALVLAGFSQPDKVADTRTTVADQLAVTATVADAGKKQTLLVTDAHGGVTFHLPRPEPSTRGWPRWPTVRPEPPS